MKLLRFSPCLRVALALACSTAACAAQPKAQTARSFDLRVEGDAVIYRGALRGDGAVQLANVLRNPERDIARLLITSPGGEGPEALLVGEAVRDRGIAVEVDRFCISACAIYVFVAGRQKTIRPGSIVAYHISPSLAVEVLRRSGNSAGAEALAPHREAAERFYRSLGADIKVLDVSATLMQPVCVGEDEAKAVQDPRRYMVAWRYGGFIPSREQLAMFGIRNVDGWWPQGNAIRPTLRQLGFRNDYRPLYAPGVETVRMAMAEKAAALPECPASLLPRDKAARQ